MDKRILKTKKALKETLFSLLKEKDFDAITATEICDKALVSRNTFYNYYSDKYALLKDCFADYEENFLRYFDTLQQKNNPELGMEKGFLNLVDTYFDTEHLYDPIPLLSSFDLMALYYRAVMHVLEKYEDKYAAYMNPDYDLTQLNAFLALGFWGFIHENQKLDKDNVKEKTKRLALDLLKSPIFQTEKEAG